MDPMRFLKTEDQMERNLMLHIADEVMEEQRRLDQNRARAIRNEIMKGLSGKSG